VLLTFGTGIEVSALFVSTGKLVPPHRAGPLAGRRRRAEPGRRCGRDDCSAVLVQTGPPEWSRYASLLEDLIWAGSDHRRWRGVQQEGPIRLWLVSRGVPGPPLCGRVANGPPACRCGGARPPRKDACGKALRHCARASTGVVTMQSRTLERATVPENLDRKPESGQDAVVISGAGSSGGLATGTRSRPRPNTMFRKGRPWQPPDRNPHTVRRSLATPLLRSPQPRSQSLGLAGSTSGTTRRPRPEPVQSVDADLNARA